MPTDAEKQEMAADTAAGTDDAQSSTAHPTTGDEAPRGNVHGEEDAGDRPGDLPPPHAG